MFFFSAGMTLISAILTFIMNWMLGFKSLVSVVGRDAYEEDVRDMARPNEKTDLSRDFEKQVYAIEITTTL